MSKVKFAIPKGSLEEATFKLLENSWTKVSRKSRTYRVESLAECADCFAGGVEFEEVGWEDRMRKEEDAI